jgi:hypothetical protein
MRVRFLLLAFFLGVAFASSAHAQVAHSLIFIIHEDSSMVYFDHSGTPQNAGENSYEQALQVATGCENCEVFLLRQSRPGLLPGLEARLDFFRNRKKIESFRYSRNVQGFDLQYESAFYLKNSQLRSDGHRYLIYFGYFIPEKEGAYSASFPWAKMSVERLVKNIRQFDPQSAGKIFDLAVLSTCQNATPWGVFQFQKVARYLVASSVPIPLQMMDVSRLQELGRVQSGEALQILSSNIARDSVQRMTGGSYSEVGVSVFDLEEVEIPTAILSRYQSLLKGEVSPTFSYLDCETLGVHLPAPSESIFIPHRILRGRPKTHSGWACPKQI